MHPLGTTALRSVIEGPAKVAGYTIDEDLVDRLVADTGTGEALPLLAFALERLAVGVKRGQELSLQRYLDLGGCGARADPPGRRRVRGCVHSGRSAAPIGFFRRCWGWRRSMSRVGRPNVVSRSTTPFANCSSRSSRVDSCRSAADGAFVSVAHEAFLVNWKPLKDEIDAQQTALRARRVVENEAADWVAGGRESELLLQGAQTHQGDG